MHGSWDFLSLGIPVPGSKLPILLQQQWSLLRLSSLDMKVFVSTLVKFGMGVTEVCFFTWKYLIFLPVRIVLCFICTLIQKERLVLRCDILWTLHTSTGFFLLSSPVILNPGVIFKMQPLLLI